MLGNLISGVGNYIGGYLGGGILSTLGKYAGRMAGNYLEKKWFQRKKFSHKFTNIRDSFYITKAEYGRPIPLVFGRMRVLGQVIWADRINEERNNSTISKYFQSTNTFVNKKTTDLEYSASFAMALCEGEITEISRIWYHDEIIDLSNYKFRLYKGSQDQEPDPLIQEKSEDPATAYRGLAYIVFEELPLSDFDNNIPNFSFEVTRKANLKNYESVENLVESMVMIPGSGEYVYDTIVQSKKHKNSPEFMSSTKINSHNNENIADSVYSLNQLQNICENVKWISPVVCWFGDNVDAEQCLIRPAVEFKDKNTSYSEEWKVGSYNRENAYEIKKDEYNNPLYGGSISDQSVVRYLMELKQRKLNIMFYPMFFLDVDQKPWRGRVTGTKLGIQKFFNCKHGYNDFILHYANLVKDHVDAFIIGSELIGLTKVRCNNSYPAVDELVYLAEKVKKIVGSKVKVSYAADWSEYHHTEGGWFNLDPIWSSNNIDFIGIDSYFPATDSISSVIDTQDLINGWSRGEGYDYYIDGNTNEKIKLDPKYAWKNVRYWWENKHINPDGKATAWLPKSKPIWFTEYGFPSIDKASNQPNVFFDPKCVDGGVPKHSNGKIDFSIQRKSIYAFIKYWSTQEYIEQMFLWTWDARPYPAWPHMDIWKDGHLWEKGHWVNNKFGNSNLASILLEISARSQIDIKKIDVSSVDIPVEGIIFSNKISAINSINTLRSSYFFDINAHNTSQIQFVKRGNNLEKQVQESDCIKITEHSFVEETEIPDSMKLSKVDLYYMDGNNDYSSIHKSFNNENNSYVQSAAINLPISLTENEAENVGNLILKNAEVENSLIRFIVPSANVVLNPCEFINLTFNSKNYNIRVINVVMRNLCYEVSALIDERNLYFRDSGNQKQYQPKTQDWQTNNQLFVDIISADSIKDIASIAINYVGTIAAPLYAKFSHSHHWQKLINVIPTKSLSVVEKFSQPNSANIFTIDETSSLIVNSMDINENQDGKWKQVLIGDEILSFKNIKKLGKDTYCLSHLIRGQKGTHAHINNHNKAEYLSLLNHNNSNLLPLSKDLINHLIDFKCGNQIVSKKLLKSKEINNIYIDQNLYSNSKLYLKWRYRKFDHDNWSLQLDRRISYKVLIHNNGNTRRWKTVKNFLHVDNIAISGDYEVNIITYVV